MAQYFYYTDPETGLRFRDGVRDAKYVVDKELTATGFNGSESTDEGLTGDWMNITETI